MTDRDKIYALFDKGQYAEARKLIRAWIAAEVHNKHWLFAKMGQSYSYEGKYAQGLVWVIRALRIRPRCPIALWEHAYILNGQREYQRAALIYRELIRRPMRTYMSGPCAQSRTWARGFVTDCCLLLGHLEQTRHRHGAAAKLYRKYILRRLKHRHRGMRWSLRSVRVNLAVQEELAKRKRPER